MNSSAELDLSHVHVLDGGVATELERRGADISGPLWSARLIDADPEAVRRMHLDYLRSGADCIATVSYQVSALGYEQLGRPRADAAQAIRRSVELARSARAEFARESARPAAVVISLGPYGAVLHNGAEFHGRYGGVGAEDLRLFHMERLEAAVRTPVSLVAFETVPSLEEARAIVAALEQFPTLSAWISFTCRSPRQVAHGEPLALCIGLAARSEQVAAVGVNCVPPSLVTDLLREARSATDKPVFVYPNSGEIWDSATRTWRGSADVAEYARLAAEWFDEGAAAVGGCCRTTPEHIRAVRAAWEARGDAA